MSEAQRDGQPSRGWCSLRLRFEERELVLLKAAEQVRGVTLARDPRPSELRFALTLAKAGHKLGAIAPGAPLSLDEMEVRLLVTALKFAAAEVQWAFRSQSDQDAGRRAAVLSAFGELAERGAYRSYGLARELEGLAARLQGALSG